MAAGEFDAEFPLSVWQTGSGTQSHMNVNEVVAQLASQALGGSRRQRACTRTTTSTCGQSSNDVFPTAMHVAVALQAAAAAGGAGTAARGAAGARPAAFADVIKIGRTHLQDATPVTLGQEFGGYDAQLALCRGGAAPARCRRCTRWPSAAPRSAPG